jgi:hypothetical protein
MGLLLEGTLRLHGQFGRHGCGLYCDRKRQLRDVHLLENSGSCKSGIGLSDLCARQDLLFVNWLLTNLQVEENAKHLQGRKEISAPWESKQC